ncbi:MAG TPA: phosphatase PAP2 family protein [Pilimelia sp.]|nr:phosphatase PAP2 family protein [Pilimelia sp.]
MTTLAPRSDLDRMRWPDEVRAPVDATDNAACDAIVGTATPRLDRVLVGVSNAANYSRLRLATAAAVAVVGGGRGRRAAGQGMLAIALTSTVTNLILNPLARRQRPAPAAGRPVPDTRRVRRTVSPSFPSGHAASAFAFASAMGHAAPGARLPLRVAAATVAYSRVHTGVHDPSDVAIGVVIGDLCGWAVGRLAHRMASSRR